MKKILPGLLFLNYLLFSFCVSASAQTQSSPYTVAQLLEQREALAASGDTVWVRADLKGLGEDGSLTDNADTEDEKGSAVHHLAALFGDATGTFTAYSWQILGGLALADLTNTRDLLIALTYGTAGHPYGNTSYPEYASNEEPETSHFSLAEVHGALSLDIPTGLRGYHIQSCYRVPEDVIAVKVSAGYSSKNGAYVNYTCFDGANGEGKVYATAKNAALVLMAAPGRHDFVLTAALHEQTMTNGNALNPGKQAGLNTATKNRALFRFVDRDGKAGFERNSQNDSEVTLESKDEIYLMVSSQATNFMGNYEFETEAKDWISWKGGQYSDFHEAAQTVKGDVNGDGSVDVADISAIITIMAGGNNDSKGDVNGDGSVDVADISAVITIMAGQ